MFLSFRLIFKDWTAGSQEDLKADRFWQNIYANLSLEFKLPHMDKNCGSKSAPRKLALTSTSDGLKTVGRLVNCWVFTGVFWVLPCSPHRWWLRSESLMIYLHRFYKGWFQSELQRQRKREKGEKHVKIFWKIYICQQLHHQSWWIYYSSSFILRIVVTILAFKCCKQTHNSSDKIQKRKDRKSLSPCWFCLRQSYRRWALKQKQIEKRLRGQRCFKLTCFIFLNSVTYAVVLKIEALATSI